jgi:hypothetical protein
LPKASFETASGESISETEMTDYKACPWEFYIFESKQVPKLGEIVTEKWGGRRCPPSDASESK